MGRRVGQGSYKQKKIKDTFEGRAWRTRRVFIMQIASFYGGDRILIGADQKIQTA